MKTIYKDNIWRQIIHFVKEERWDGEYTRETDLVKDLQLKGDDAYEFICLFSKKFNVDIVDFNLKTKRRKQEKNNTWGFRKRSEGRKISLILYH